MRKLLYILLLFSFTVQSQFIGVVASSGSSTYLLDDHPNAAAAYSLRKLRTGETDAVEIRRSSDNATTIVYLESSGSITLSSTVSAGGYLSAWVGSNSAYVRTWYDQSGNGNDATQTNTSNQPRLINSGSLETTNNKTSIKNVVTGLLQAPRLLSTGLWSIHGVFEWSSVAATSNQFINQHTGSASSGRTIFVNSQSASPTHCMFFNNGTSYSGLYSSNWLTQQYHISSYGDNNDYYFSRNGDTPELLITGQSIVLLNTNFNIGNYGNGATSADMSGSYQEIIVYASDQSSNRIAIETDINNYYSIY